MKNIGIVTTWFERGAAYVSKQYRDLLKDDFNVFIYARGGEDYAIGNPEWDDETVTWGKKIQLPVPMPIDKNDFEKWIKKNNIEIILFNEQQWWIPIIWAKELGVICGAYIDYYTEETIPLFKSYDFLICNTKRHYEAFNWHENCFYIPWGTDIGLFKPDLKTPNENECITFFHSCGMSPIRKGTDQLLKAFKNVEGNKKLIIHAQNDIVLKLPNEKEVIEELILNNELEIIEKTVGAPGLYREGDVYVYPSRLEGIGLTIAEAISCGLPTIVPDNGPMNEFIDEASGKIVKVKRYFSREDGYYWPQCEIDIADLTLQMQYYVNNVSNIKSLKENARDFAIQNLDWNKNKEAVISLFDSVNYKKHNNYDEMYKYEAKKSNNHWARNIYFKYPKLFNLLINTYSIKDKFAF